MERDEDTEQLASKARTLLLNRIGKAKTVPEEFDGAEVAALLQRMHTEARESQSNDVSNVSQASQLVLDQGGFVGYLGGRQVSVGW